MIDEFVGFKRGSVTEKRLILIHNSMVKFANLLELDFDKASKDDITKAWNIILSSTEFTIKTRQDEYLHIRQVFKHWFGEDEEYPKVVRGMKRPKGRGHLRLLNSRQYIASRGSQWLDVDLSEGIERP